MSSAPRLEASAGAGMDGADAVQAAEQLAFDEHGRVGKSFHGERL